MAKGTAGAPGNAPQTQRLTREIIARTTLDMADTMGITNVSVRKLASELGVTAMALYRYYDSMDDIQAAAVALAFTEVDTNSIPGERWDDTMRRTMSSIRDMYLNHAAADLLAIEGAGDSPAMQAHTERIYSLHEAQNIPADILRKTWRIVDAYLGGFLKGELIEIKNEHRHPQDSPDAEWRQTAAGAYSEETFHDGIDIIIAGIRTMAAPDPCEWHTPEA